MRRFEHALIGGASTVLAMHFLLHLDTTSTGIAAVIGSVVATLPDIDNAVGLPPLERGQAICRPVLNPFEHRGMTHSLLVALGAAWIVSAAVQLIVPQYWQVWVGQAIAVGWISHLVADGLWSPMGVPFLWPGDWRRFVILPRPIRIKSGSPIDMPVALGLVAATWWFVR